MMLNTKLIDVTTWKFSDVIGNHNVI